MIELKPLAADDREQFITDNQEAFNYGAMEEFGLRDDHFEEEGEIISRQTIEASIDGGEAYRITFYHFLLTFFRFFFFEVNAESITFADKITLKIVEKRNYIK